ncbi:hypothetical protein [Bradyrhizobium nanningense]|uniref:hypothetical protein n=1 Tax=Bradyrhizobium nanningense TaxID=1325118 RepID=UPI0013E8E893|nr:hypothetical protein [Bradyrhizobium nanningense]
MTIAIVGRGVSSKEFFCEMLGVRILQQSERGYNEIAFNFRNVDFRVVFPEMRI